MALARTGGALSVYCVVSRAGTTIHQFLQDQRFGPEEIALLVAAYRGTLDKLGLAEKDDPVTQMIAKKIIEVGQRGVRDPKQLSELAMRDIGMI